MTPKTQKHYLFLFSTHWLIIWFHQVCPTRLKTLMVPVWTNDTTQCPGCSDSVTVCVVPRVHQHAPTLQSTVCPWLVSSARVSAHQSLTSAPSEKSISLRLTAECSEASRGGIKGTENQPACLFTNLQLEVGARGNLAEAPREHEIPIPESQSVNAPWTNPPWQSSGKLITVGADAEEVDCLKFILLFSFDTAWHCLSASDIYTLC